MRCAWAILSHLWPIRLCSIFTHYLINGTIFEKKNHVSYSALPYSCLIHLYVVLCFVCLVRCDVQRWNMQKKIDATRYIVPYKTDDRMSIIVLRYARRRMRIVSQGRLTLWRHSALRCDVTLSYAVTWLFTRKTPSYKTYTCQYQDTYLIIPRSFLLRMRNGLEKIVEKIKKKIILCSIIFLSKIVPFMR
jgi:hypothetical protein